MDAIALCYYQCIAGGSRPAYYVRRRPDETGPSEMISEHQEQMDADYLLRLTNAGPYTGRRITLRLEDDDKTLLQGSRQEILMESLI